jgi:crossover junction endonuclease MUS81
MKACPLKFDHPSDAQQLHGIGPKLCDRLADKLRAHCAANGLPMPQLPHRGTKRYSGDEDNGEVQTVKKARTTKPYVPVLRSGAYALVLALATLGEDNTQGLTKSEAIELAQPHCDTSFTAPSDPTKFFTAWNSMKTLVGKDLVYERGRPLKRYMLTDDGWEVARRMQGIQPGPIPNLPPNNEAVSARINGRSDIPAGGEGNFANKPRASATKSASWLLEELPSLSSIADIPWAPSEATFAPTQQHLSILENDEDRINTTSSEFAPILIPAGTFTVQLVLDTREVRTKTDRDYISEQLDRNGVKAITRPLPVGDALWIAKLNAGSEHILTSSNIGDEGEGQDEIMLDHIVERKRLDDLIGSIKDGRFHEQKFRLRRSGVKNVTYIIESFSISTENEDKYGDAVSSAIVGTQVVDSYFVKQTAKLDDTIRYLARMTKALQASYENHDLHVIPSKVIQAQTYLPLITQLRSEHPSKGHFITFSAFCALCGKSDMMTLRDVFLKMLMCTRGVTGEKALEIQRRWSTPSDFIRAFESRKDQKAKETMVSERLGTLIPRKKMAKGLSGKIAEVWG